MLSTYSLCGHVHGSVLFSHSSCEGMDCKGNAMLQVTVP